MGSPGGKPAVADPLPLQVMPAATAEEHQELVQQGVEHIITALLADLDVSLSDH